MAKITVTAASSGHKGQATIDSNFTAIETELNSKVLYRDNPAGEANQMENDIDMNSNNINNCDQLAAASILLNGVALNPSTATLSPFGVRNLFRNGAMRINQREATYNAAYFSTSLAYCLDGVQFKDDNAGTPVFSAAQATVAVADADNVGGCSNYLRVTKTDLNSNVNTANPIIKAHVEDVYVTAGQSVVVSFYAKMPVGATSELAFVDLVQNFGSGGSASVSTNLATDATVTTTWTRYSYTLTVPVIDGKTVGDAHSIQIQLQLPKDQLYTFDVTGLQVELASTLNAFENKPKGLDIAWCKRFFRKLKIVGNANELYIPADADTSTYRSMHFDLGEMRSTPTITIKGTTSGWDGSGALTDSISPTGFRIYGDAAAATTSAIVGGWEAVAEL